MDKIVKAINKIETGRLFSYSEDNLDSIVWHDLDTKSAISKEDIQAKIDEEADIKASAKAKLMAGEPMTKEANHTSYINHKFKES